MNLLFSNAGRRTYLIEDALALAREKDSELKIFVSDASPNAAAMLVSPDVTTLQTPRVSADPEEYANALLEQCVTHAIDIVIPLMDFELRILSARREDFEAEGITVLVSSASVIRDTLDKRKCHAFCEQRGLSMPRTWFPGEQTVGAMLPLILKPTQGSGSVGICSIDAQSQIPEVVPLGFLLQEMVEGQEYGMDILNGLNGEFLHCCTRRKLLMRGGETDHAEVIYEDRFQHIGKRVSEAFGHIGNMDLDFILEPCGNIVFLDFNPRFGGGYPFTRAAGFDYLRAILDMKSDRSPRLPLKGLKIVGAKGLRLYTIEFSR